MDPFPIVNEGVYASLESFRPAEIKTEKLKFSASASFADLCKDYVFYSTAAVTLYGGFSFDVITNFYSSRNLTQQPIVLVTDMPLFEGLGTSNVAASLSRTLFAIQKDMWQDLAFHLGTMGVKNDREKIYFGTEVQKIPMVDYLKLKHMTSLSDNQLPMIDIYTVALDGNKACLHFLPAVNPPAGKIRFVKSAPRQSVIEYADTLFNKERL